MKRKRRLICLIAALTAVLCLLTACGKSNDGAGNYAPGVSGGTDIKSETVSDERKIIVRADYSIETLTFDDTLKQIEAAVVRAGGYISESRVTPAYDGDRGHAMLTLRIPSAASDGFATELSGVGNVTSANVTKTNVTLTYDDLSARVAVLRAEQTKLLELMDSASGISETLEIEKRYSEVTQELSSYESRLNSLENAVSYATFSVSLYDVKSYSEGNENYITRFGRSFGKSFVSFAKVLGNILIALVYILPYALIIAAVTALVVVLTRKNKNKKRQGRPDGTPPAPGTAVPVRFGVAQGTAQEGASAPAGTDGEQTAGETAGDATAQEGDAV